MTAERRIVPVLLDETDPDLSDRHRAVLATLPSSYGLASKAAGAVAVVATSGPDWSERAIRLLADGASALLVTIGEYVDAASLDAVEQAGRSAGKLLIADLEYAADPAWAAVARATRPDDLGLIDGFATTAGSLRAAMVRLLVTVAVAMGELAGLDSLGATAEYLVLGSSDAGVPVTLSVARSDHEAGQRLDLVSREVRYEVCWPDRPRAAPIMLYTHTATGTVRAPLSYQAPELGSWRRIYSMVRDSGSDVSLDLMRVALSALPPASAVVPQ